ncbi:hypothetical protein [Piscinibacter sakaiensis]|uniref:hypothetical protein n=1 Tax=Piscinibacter sakaiensis TaxID=1547922 RepID=UPI0006B61750|nr:hypothetical protein [Piscinibacter sakaiensis]
MPPTAVSAATAASRHPRPGGRPPAPRGGAHTPAALAPGWQAPRPPRALRLAAGLLAAAAALAPVLPGAWRPQRPAPEGREPRGVAGPAPRLTLRLVPAPTSASARRAPEPAAARLPPMPLDRPAVSRRPAPVAVPAPEDGGQPVLPGSASPSAAPALAAPAPREASPAAAPPVPVLAAAASGVPGVAGAGVGSAAAGPAAGPLADAAASRPLQLDAATLRRAAAGSRGAVRAQADAAGRPVDEPRPGRDAVLAGDLARAVKPECLAPNAGGSLLSIPFIVAAALRDRCR